VLYVQKDVSFLLIFTAIMLFVFLPAEEKKVVPVKSTEAIEKEVLAEVTGTTMSDDGELKTLTEIVTVITHYPNT